MRLVFALALAAAVPVCRAAPPPPIIPIADFVSQDNYRMPVLSPDGRHLALTMDVRSWFLTYATVVIVALPEMKVAGALRMAPDEFPHRYRWISPGRLVISKARQYLGLDFPYPTGELLSAEIDGTQQQYLYGRRRIIKGGNGYFGDLGKGMLEGVPEPLNGHVLLTEHPSGNKGTVLWDIDSTDASRKIVTELPIPWLRFWLAADGTPRLAVGARDGKRLVRRLDGLNGWVPEYGDGGEESEVLEVSADGNEVYERAHRPGATDILTARQVGDPTVRVLAALPDGDPDLLELALDRRRPIAVASQMGQPKWRYLDDGPDARLHQSLSAQFPGQLVQIVGGSADRGKVLFRVVSDRDPGTYYLYDRARGVADLLYAALEKIKVHQMPARQPIQFTARDGVQLHGYLTEPVSGTVPPGQRPPLILLPHGGPHGVADTWLFDTDAAFLASRGYAVLQVNYRGSGGRGRDFQRSGYRKWGTAIIDDLIDGVRWTVGQGRADEQRVCAFGASFGAYAAMMVAIREPRMFRCVAGLAGVYDLAQLRSEASVNLAYLDEAIGKDDAELAAQSPARQAARLKAPVFLSHGKADGRAEVTQVKTFIRALKDADNAPEYWEARGEAHSYYSAENRAEFYQRLERFLARHLKGER